jgi:uncharacterized protein YeaO (DUF488 family)
MDLRMKRIYEPPTANDGTRVLVDGLWPRGVSRARAALDEWAIDLAPSPELRRWFDHDPERFPEFRRRYRDELAQYTALLERLHDIATRGRVTLVYAARDEEHNNAQVVAEMIREMAPPATEPVDAA